MDGDELWELVEGLKANCLVRHSHLLTGAACSRRALGIGVHE